MCPLPSLEIVMITFSLFAGFCFKLSTKMFIPIYVSHLWSVVTSARHVVLGNRGITTHNQDSIQSGYYKASSSYHVATRLIGIPTCFMFQNTTRLSIHSSNCLAWLIVFTVSTHPYCFYLCLQHEKYMLTVQRFCFRCAEIKFCLVPKFQVNMAG